MEEYVWEKTNQVFPSNLEIRHSLQEKVPETQIIALTIPQMAESPKNKLESTSIAP